ncbi:peptidase inhibitor family I36 protein [Devosia sp.]|uniref:peptidase inhibitor family I36 protein n=1 Tax=Devosia sp. TaxID=1871048 RepID=UPI003A8DE960
MKSLIAGLAAFLLLTFGASAIETGTPAWTNTTVTLTSGPGSVYPVTGTLEGKLRIRVDRCYKLWCLVRANGVKGWALEQYLAFGHEPWPTPFGPSFSYKSGGPGEVCLYSGANYTGTALCGGPGLVSRDLQLRGFDNTISSVRITGNVSVTLCRDRFFRSYCERIDESEPRIHGFLNNDVSAFHIY